MRTVFLFVAFYLLLFLPKVVIGKTAVADSTVLAELYLNTGGPEGKWINQWPYDASSGTFNSDPSEWYGVKVNALGFVTAIELSNNGLDGVFDGIVDLPDGLAVFSKLKLVDVSNNSDLADFLSPTFLEILSSVKELNISGTKVSGEIPSDISLLQKLEIFDVSSTAISGIPSTISELPNLEKLILSSNEIVEFPSALSELGSLTALYLDDNKIINIQQLAVNNVSGLTVYMQNNYLDFCDMEDLQTGFPNATILFEGQLNEGGTIPESVFVDLDANVTLQAAVCGSENLYQWQINMDNNWIDLTGSIQDELLVSKAAVRDNGLYRCKVTNTTHTNFELFSKQYLLIVNPDLAPDFTILSEEDMSASFVLPNYYAEDQFDAFQLLVGAGNFLSCELLSQAKNGSVTVKDANSLSFQYNPSLNYFGLDSVSYRLFNSAIDISFTGTMYFNINPVNDKPSLQIFELNSSLEKSELNLEVEYGSTVSFHAILSDIADSPLDCPLSLVKTSSTLNGGINYNSTTQIGSYKPVKNVNGVDVLTVTARENCENPKQSNPKIIRVTIHAKINNDKPVARDTLIILKQGDLIQFPLTVSDTETPNENIRVNHIRDPQHALFFNIEKGQVSFRPQIDFLGEDAFTYSVTDEEGAESEQATLTFRVEHSLKVLEARRDTSYVVNASLLYHRYEDQIQAAYRVETTNAELGADDNGAFKQYKTLSSSRENYMLFDLEKSYPISRIGMDKNIVQHFMFLHGSESYLDQLNAFYNDKFITVEYRNMETSAIEGVQNLSLVLQEVQSNQLPAVQSTLHTAVDTFWVEKNKTDTLYVSAACTFGDFEITLLQAPHQGDLSNFGPIEFEHSSIGMYQANFNSQAEIGFVDSLVYRVSNSLETQTSVLYIVTRGTAKTPEIEAISDQEIMEDEILLLDVSIGDNDNTKEEVFSNVEISSSNIGFKAELINDQLTITPPENYSGVANVLLQLIDADFNTAHVDFDLTVLPVNDAPVIEIEGDTIVGYNTLLELKIIASDVELQQLELNAFKLPDWITFTRLSSGIGTVSGNPQLSDEGTYNIRFEASDGAKLTVMEKQIKVLGRELDLGPVVEQPIGPIDLPKKGASKSVSLDGLFADPDGDPIELSILSNSNEDWLNVEILNDELLISVVDENYTGYATITLQAKSNGLQIESDLVIYTIDNSPEVNEIIENQLVWKNSEPLIISLSNVFIDPDGDELSYSVLSNSNGNIVGASINDSNLILNFTEGAGGESNVYVTASAFGKSVSTAFNISIKDVLPELHEPIGDQTIGKELSSLELPTQRLFSDPDDAKVEVSIVDFSNKTLISNATHENDLLKIEFIPYQSGSSTVTLQGKTNDNTILHEFTVVVLDQAPVVSNPITLIEMYFDQGVLTLDLNEHFTDRDNDPIFYTMLSNSNDALVESQILGRFIQVQFNENSPVQFGESTLIVSANSDQHSVSMEFKVKVMDYDNPPFVKNAFGDQETLKNSGPLSIDASNLFEDPEGTEVFVTLQEIGNTKLVESVDVLNGTELQLNFVANQSGQSEIILNGSSNNRTANYTFLVTVLDQAPVLLVDFEDLALQNKDRDKEYVLADYFYDPDQEQLEYSIVANTNPDLIRAEIVNETLVVGYNSEKDLLRGTGTVEIQAQADGQTITGRLNVVVTLETDITVFSENAFAVFPNPSRDVIHVSTRINWGGTVTFSLFSLDGKVLKPATELKKDVDNYKAIDLSDFQPGVYLLKIASGDWGVNYRIVKM